MMQRDNERGLVTVEHKRTDDGVCLKPGSVHLLMADTALDEQHRCRFYLAMCGAELSMDARPELGAQHWPRDLTPTGPSITTPTT